jgi:cyanophycin synthetase
VIGNGTDSIQALIDTANEHPARGGPYFSKMAITPEAVAELFYQNLTPEEVPEAGRRVQLHQKINWSVGGTTADVTDLVHPDNAALFERIAEVLKAPIVGIDFIVGDISRSWQEQERSGVIECNSMPFFDNHHLPFAGQPRNVAARIWDMVS